MGPIDANSFSKFHQTPRRTIWQKTAENLSCQSSTDTPVRAVCAVRWRGSTKGALDGYLGEKFSYQRHDTSICICLGVIGISTEETSCNFFFVASIYIKGTDILARRVSGRKPPLWAEQLGLYEIFKMIFFLKPFVFILWNLIWELFWMSAEGPKWIWREAWEFKWSWLTLWMGMS